MMFVSESLNVNDEGHLEIGGCDSVELASQYGTPLYVMDEQLIRKNCRAFKSSLDKFYDGNGMVLYASKAFCSLYICKIIKEEGLGLDVVSGGEIYTALKAGFPAEKIYFHGNNKTFEEIEMALDNKIGRIMVDNLEELVSINSLAQKKGLIANVSFRIKPGIDAHTHEFIKTGQIDSKFGFALETGEAIEIIEKAVNLKNINIVGLHCHIGSQIFDVNPFVEAAEVMMNLILEIREKFGIKISELNLGGGFGIKYTSEEEHENYEAFLKAVSKKIKSICKEKDFDVPQILIEPGRAIVGAAGITLYTVGSVKQIPGIRKYVSVDGGMSDNPRYILYQAEHEAVCANKANEPKKDVITLAGKCCESGDLIGEGMKLQEVKAGDIVAVMSTGAYNYSMSSNYNRIPRPAVVMVKEGTHKLIVKRENYEDLIKNDLIN